MILNSNLNISIKEIREGLDAALSIFEPKWLGKQHKKQPNDPLLFHLKPTVSANYQIEAIRQGLSHEMHPLAEAVLIGEEINKQYQKDGRLCFSNLTYLLVSIRDILKNKDKIGNFGERLLRLQSVEWKSTLYELLIAASYANNTIVNILPERNVPTPDIRISYNPALYVECKAKLRYEDEIIKFINRWRLTALGEIASFLRNVDAGFLVKIIIKNRHSPLEEIPIHIKRMVSKGIEELALLYADIKIIPFESTEVSPDREMSLFSEEYWEWAIGFKDWNDWHYILPGGLAQFNNLSNLIIKKISRPVLICVKAEYLADNTQKILPTLKYACKKQLKDHKPSIIHMLINTNLFGLGEKSDNKYIIESLSNSSQEIFNNYSRIWKIVFDIVRPPRWGKHFAQLKRISLVNNRCKYYSKDYMEPLPVILW
jgi:hypothetical protein